MGQQFDESFFDVLWYNGYEDEVGKLLKYMKNSKPLDEYATLPIPDYLRDEDCDFPPRLLWSCLVIMFGDYGTSPRYGWIDRLDEAIAWIENHGITCCKDCKYSYTQEAWGIEQEHFLCRHPQAVYGDPLYASTDGFCWKADRRKA